MPSHYNHAKSKQKKIETIKSYVKQQNFLPAEVMSRLYVKRHDMCVIFPRYIQSVLVKLVNGVESNCDSLQKGGKGKEKTAGEDNITGYQIQFKDDSFDIFGFFVNLCGLLRKPPDILSGPINMINELGCRINTD